MPGSFLARFLTRALPIALTGLALIGCPGSGGSTSGSAATAGGEDEDEDEENPDSLVLAGWELPIRPHDVHFDEGPLADGATLARETVRDERPPLDAAATPTEMHEYVDGPLHEWLLRRARAVRDARVALGSAEEEGEDAEHIVAAAIVGILYADLGWAIAEIAIPIAVREDELGSLAMRNALLEMSAPLFDQALSAFGACASSAVGSADPTVERWARFCDEESERLVDAPRPITAGTRDEEADAPGDD